MSSRSASEAIRRARRESTAPMRWAVSIAFTFRRGFRFPIWQSAQLTAFLTKFRPSVASRRMTGRNRSNGPSFAAFVLNGLYPEIEPFEHGMLEVGDGNLVYWESCGDPRGKPAVVLHGGLGSGCTPWHRRLFDPNAYGFACSTSGVAAEARRTRASARSTWPATPPRT